MSAFLRSPVFGPNKTLPLETDECVLGSAAGNDIVINDPAVSRCHAVLRRKGDQWLITDQGSTNGTLVDGRRISGPVLLKNGSVIRVGNAQLTFDRSSPVRAQLPKTAKGAQKKRRKDPFVEVLVGLWALVGCLLLAVSAYRYIQTGTWPSYSIADWLGATPGDFASLMSTQYAGWNELVQKVLFGYDATDVFLVPVGVYYLLTAWDRVEKLLGI